MIISGSSLIEELLGQTYFEAKCVFNEEAVVFFPVSKQHRDIKLYGLNYDDDYRGNALAAMIKPGVVEIRYHKAFSDAQVRLIWNRIMIDPAGEFLLGWKVTYQGREL